MNTTRGLLTVLVLLCACTQASALVDSGMVLLHTATGTTPGGEGKLELIYLSTGHRVVFEETEAWQARFSPDGQNVAFSVTEGAKMRTANLDGSIIRSDFGTLSRGGFNWCSNGYLYSHGGNGVVRMLAAGGSPREQVYTCHSNTTTPWGEGLGTRLNDASFSLDATRAAGTVGKDGGGFAMMCVNLVDRTQFSPGEPCQGAVSPSGTFASVGNGGHNTYRVWRWEEPYDYQEFPPDGGDTYSGCRPERICPTDETVFAVRDSIRSLCGCPDAKVDINMPRWSCIDDNIYLVQTRPDASLPPECGGSYVIEMSTMEYTKIGPQGTWVMDFYPTEIMPGSESPFTLTPTQLLFTVTEGSSEVPPAKTIVLSATDGISSAPQVESDCEWLEVTATGTAGTTWELTNSLVAAALPATGTAVCTVMVTPAGATQALRYTVELIVEAAVPDPITIQNPGAGDTYRIGDTLRVRYSADMTEISGVVLSLSLNDGESYTLMHTDASQPAGPDQVFDYVIPEHLTIGASQVSTVSSTCVIMVSSYPAGTAMAISGMFSIAEASAVRGATSRLCSGVRGLRVTLRRQGRAATLAVQSPARGIGRIIDMRGREQYRCALGAGRQRFSLERLRAGRLVFQVLYDNGAEESVPFTTTTARE